MILEKYKKIEKGSNQYNNIYSLSKESKGIFYESRNTNFRTLKAFFTAFTKFEEIEGLHREKWPKVNSHKQEKNKQHSVKMLGAYFFDTKSKTYFKTVKGKVYKNFLEDQNISKDNKWILNLMFLLTLRHENITNYLIKRTKKINNDILKVYKITELRKILKDFLSLKNNKEIYINDWLYINSFFYEESLLFEFKNSSDKDELKNYVSQNIKIKNYICPLSHKYKDSGNYNYAMLKEDAEIFYIINNVFNKQYSYSDFFDLFLEVASEIKEIDKELVKNFINKNKDIFMSIHYELFFEEESENLIEDSAEQIIIETSPVKKVDYSSYLYKREMNNRFSKLKKYVKEASGYQCELSELRSCTDSHFLSRVDNKNFLEVHHLIPKQFANEFEYSIEVLPNYVSLCPNCHRFIHNGLDKERKQAVIKLHEERREDLEKMGLIVEREKILKINNIKTSETNEF